MPKEPPFCVICEKDFSDNLEALHYCICDKAVCSNCLNSVKKNTEIWVCPDCHAENNIKESRLFRNTE
jgi:hypothetical protein